MKSFTVLIFLIFVVTACRLTQRRPDGVPSDSVWVPTPKGGLWQVCEQPVQASIQVRCSIYNSGGKILSEEDYVAVDRMSVGPKVVIDPTANLVGTQWINIKAGRILVPVSRATELRRFLEGSASK